LADFIRIQGAQVIPSLNNMADTPEPCEIALHHLFVDATKHPSIVAIGIYIDSSFKVRGPTMPTRRGIHPTTILQFAPDTRE